MLEVARQHYTFLEPTGVSGALNHPRGPVTPA